MRMGSTKFRVALAGLLLSSLLAVWVSQRERSVVQRPQQLAGIVSQATWRQMVESEELIAVLEPPLRRIARSLENLQLPDRASRAHFDVAVSTLDMEAQGSTEPVPGLTPAARLRFPATTSMSESSANDLQLWQPLLERVQRIDRSALKVENGEFENEARTRFATQLVWSALARLRDGEIAQLKAKLTLRWQRPAESDALTADSWRIVAWETHALESLQAQDTWFEDVLDRVLPDLAERRAARRSRHEEMLIAILAGQAPAASLHPYFDFTSHDRHPAVSVVDVNGDGWSDFYVMARWGPNQLFVNQRDGSFREQAADYGLALEDHSAAALFADFDNDGDPDLFLGRTLESSRYLRNDGGHFIDASAQAAPAGALPALVASLSAADYDGDGLLDVYVSTYAAEMRRRETRRAREQGQVLDALLADFLPRPDAEELLRRVASPEAHRVLASPGPPNLLLRNLGGNRFAPADVPELRIFRNTYQATWADYDRDGDADLYLAHDFSPNQLFRNDGHGFTDVTAETGTADLGFGMGAGWGDYDRDGRPDLYLSNMFSNAGNRVVSHFDVLDPRFVKMARGNTLFRNAGGDRFEQVSGLDPGELPVEIAGWSWGGQFLDLDNDADLDLYALSGYYTSPDYAAGEVDI